MLRLAGRLHSVRRRTDVTLTERSVRDHKQSRIGLKVTGEKLASEELPFHSPQSTPNPTGENMA